MHLGLKMHFGILIPLCSFLKIPNLDPRCITNQNQNQTEGKPKARVDKMAGKAIPISRPVPVAPRHFPKPSGRNPTSPILLNDMWAQLLH
jgi:hypothetical protein